MAPTIDISSWFDQEAYSDVTLKFGDREIKCHKIVLSYSSEYIKKLLNPEGGFAESQQKTIELKGDAPDAVAAMIRYIYSFDYCSGVDVTLQRSPSFHVDVYKVAHKYLLPELQTKAMARLSTMLRNLEIRGDKAWKSKDIFQLVRLLAAHREYDDRFGSEMQDLAIRHIWFLIRIKEFRAWMEGEGESILPEFFKVVSKGAGSASSSWSP